MTFWALRNFWMVPYDWKPWKKKEEFFPRSTIFPDISRHFPTFHTLKSWVFTVNNSLLLSAFIWCLKITWISDFKYAEMSENHRDFRLLIRRHWVAIFTRDPVVILPRVPRFPGCFFVPTSIPWLFPQDYKGLSSLMLQKIVINSNKLDCATSSITSIRQCNDIGHRWEFFCVYLQSNVFKLIMQHSMDMTYRNAGGGFLNCTIFFIMKCAFC